MTKGIAMYKSALPNMMSPKHISHTIQNLGRESTKTARVKSLIQSAADNRSGYPKIHSSMDSPTTLPRITDPPIELIEVVIAA